MANLKYITLSQLMASVESDFSTYADNALIDRGKLIKIVRRVNEDIGLKINKEKEEVIEICNYKGNLPEDFKALQLALICSTEPTNFKSVGSVVGTHTEEVSVPVQVNKSMGACINECDGCYWVVQKFKEKTIKYDRLVPIRVTNKSLNFCTDNCANKSWNKATYELDLDNEEVVTNFREGKLYINYIADMVSKDGELLIIDHPMLLPYYEYAIKKHLLENWMVNKTADVAQLVPYYKEELRQARISALNFINTIEYSQIMEVYKANRTRFYNKYHKIFDDGSYN